MPYKKSYKRKYKARPGYISCGKMVMSDAARALQMAKYLKGIVNVEFKNHDVQQIGVPLSNAVTITQLTNIAQGDTTLTRDGSSCKVMSIMLNYTLQVNSSAAGIVIRIMLVHDKQTNQAIYTSGDLLADTTIVDSLVSPRNLDNKLRFTVLYDRVHTLSVTNNQKLNFKVYKKLNIKLRFDNAAGAITSLTQSSLSLVNWSDEPTNEPSITSFVRLRFVDN